jgi:hypothetical protein
MTMTLDTGAHYLLARQRIKMYEWLHSYAGSRDGPTLSAASIGGGAINFWKKSRESARAHAKVMIRFAPMPCEHVALRGSGFSNQSQGEFAVQLSSRALCGTRTGNLRAGCPAAVVSCTHGAAHGASS